MNKRLVPIAIAVLVVGGGVGFALTRGDKDSKPNTSSSSKPASAFDVVSTKGVSFVATIEVSSGNTTISSKMESDAKTGAIRYVSSAGGQSVNFIYTSDAYYMCQSSDTCYKYPLGQGNGASFDPKTYEYSDAKIAEYRAGSSYDGKKACSTGTCDVWKIKSGENESVVYVDTKTKRVVQMEGTSAAGLMKITYDYRDDISVTIPTNVQTLPSL
jgi:hypothetical protein